MKLMDKMRDLFALPEPPQEARLGSEPEPAGAFFAPAGSPPRSVRFLLDNSGSMGDTDFPPSRIEAAVDAAEKTVNGLARSAPECLVGIGTFGSGFHLCIDPTPAGAGYQDIINSLGNLGSGGSTQMAKGLRGIQKMGDKCPEGGPNLVLMLTDGHNTGRSPRKIAEELKASGAEFWAIGIGGSPSDVDEALLRKIVSSEDHYIFIGNWEGADAISDTFQNIVNLTIIDEDNDDE